MRLKIDQDNIYLKESDYFQRKLQARESKENEEYSTVYF